MAGNIFFYSVDGKKSHRTTLLMDQGTSAVYRSMLGDVCTSARSSRFNNRLGSHILNLEISITFTDIKFILNQIQYLSESLRSKIPLHISNNFYQHLSNNYNKLLNKLMTAVAGQDFTGKSHKYSYQLFS